MFATGLTGSVWLNGDGGGISRPSIRTSIRPLSRTRTSPRLMIHGKLPAFTWLMTSPGVLPVRVPRIRLSPPSWATAAEGVSASAISGTTPASASLGFHFMSDLLGECGRGGTGSYVPRPDRDYGPAA